MDAASDFDSNFSRWHVVSEANEQQAQRMGNAVVLRVESGDESLELPPGQGGDCLGCQDVSVFLDLEDQVHGLSD